jgi:broad specificity phosphatase PhoE
VNNPLGFEFARKMRDPAFRARLHEVGWSSGMAVYPALPGETYAEVRARMEPGRHLLVAENPEQPFQMRMIVCEVDR